MSHNAARPSEVELDDPSLNTPEFEDASFPFRKHPRARTLARLGLEDKAYDALYCGMYCIESCENHGERHRTKRSCNQRFCPHCGLRDSDEKFNNHWPKLDLAKSLGCKFVLFRASFGTSLKLDDPRIKEWQEEQFDYFTERWREYILDIPAIFYAVSCTGFENQHGTEHLVCYAMLATTDPSIRFAYQAPWTDACEFTIEETLDAPESHFRRVVTIPEMDAERSALHESIFKNHGRLLRTSQFPKDLSTKTPAEIVDKCAKEVFEFEPETPPEPSVGPRKRRCCDICGALLRVSFKDPYDLPTG
jgi:hypothetical protein